MHVNISIVGLDRISTSFGLALKRYEGQSRAQHTFTIIGSDVRVPPMKAAHKLGAIDNFDRKLLKATENADVIIIKDLPSRLEATYERLGPTLKAGAVVLDMSELKATAIQYASEYFPTNEQGQPLAYLVGVTPIIGVRGLYTGAIDAEAASDDLFDRAEFLLTPDPQCPSEAIALAEDIIRLVGGLPRFMDPAEHDGLIAATEGLPTLIGASLFYTLQQSEGWMELRRMVNPTLALTFHALRAHSPADLMATLADNRLNVARHLEALIDTLQELLEALREEDTEALEAFLSVVGKEWEHWDVKRHSGKWEEGAKFETLPGPLGAMGGFLTMRRSKDTNGEEN